MEVTRIHRPDMPLESVVLYYYRPRDVPIGFYVTEQEFVSLNGGRGTLIGRTPWGPWCRLKIYDYRVVGVCIIRDKATLAEIKERMES